MLSVIIAITIGKGALDHGNPGAFAFFVRKYPGKRGRGMFAEKKFINGRIYTMKSEGDVCEALAVSGGKIVAAGTNEEIGKIETGETVDLGGRAVYPGFTDAHMHLYSYAVQLSQVDLRECRSMEELQEAFLKKAKETPKGTWIIGSGFNQEHFQDPRMPTRKELDAVSTEHPILAERCCGHVACVNTPALELSDAEHKLPDPSVLDRDEDGCPNGILRETAISPVTDCVPDPYPSFESKVNALERAARKVSASGITSVHTIQVKFGGMFENLSLYQELEQQGRLPLRAYVSFDDYPSFGMRTGFGNDKIKTGFYKIITDGSLGSHNAALREPYSDDPSNSGILYYPQETLTELCRKAYELDVQLGIHAIGDRALENVVTALETVYTENKKSDPRFRIIHATCCSPELIRRMKELPVILDVQPPFITSDLDWAPERLGPERIKNAYLAKTYLDNGFLLTGSSDSPVDPFDPFYGIWSVVCRRAADGHPADGWRPEECIGVYDALCMYTKNAAYASFEENLKGTLEPGKLADFVVASEDLFRIDPFCIKDVIALSTYLGGEEVYRRGE